MPVVAANIAVSTAKDFLNNKAVPAPYSFGGSARGEFAVRTSVSALIQAQQLQDLRLRVLR